MWLHTQMKISLEEMRGKKIYNLGLFFHFDFPPGNHFFVLRTKDSNSTVSSIAHSSARAFLVLLGVSKGHNYQNRITGHYLVEI